MHDSCPWQRTCLLLPLLAACRTALHMLWRHAMFRERVGAHLLNSHFTFCPPPTHAQVIFLHFRQFSGSWDLNRHKWVLGWAALLAR